ncbi:Hypothetical protein FKW44_005724, partial [Caligus rogercresseyi]
ESVLGATTLMKELPKRLEEDETRGANIMTGIMPPVHYHSEIVIPSKMNQ